MAPVKCSFRDLQVLTDAGLADVASTDGLDDLHVRIEAASQPLLCFLLAASKHDQNHHWHDDEDEHGHDQRWQQEVIEQGMQQHGHQQAGEKPLGAGTILSFQEAMSNEPDDGRRTSVQDGRPKASHEPQHQWCLAEVVHIVEVLDQGETGADGETQDGRIHSKANLVGADEQEQVEALQ